MSRRRSLLAILVTSTALLATGCMTGERPSFSDAPTGEGTASGDPVIDGVLALMDSVESTAVFRADYSITQIYDGAVTPAIVTFAGPDRRSTTIGGYRFLDQAGALQTCDLSTGECSGSLDAQPISDTGATPGFATGDFAKRLRRDAASAIGPATSTSTTIAGQTATCIEVTLSTTGAQTADPTVGTGSGVKTYCVLADGVLAGFTGPDVTVEMTAYTPTADEALFATS